MTDGATARRTRVASYATRESTSADTGAWFPLDQARALPLVDLADHGIRLAERALASPAAPQPING